MNVYDGDNVNVLGMISCTDIISVLQTARWSDIINVFKSEQNKLVKPSKLTEVSVFPKPIERQKVSTCLKIFSEEAVAALTNVDLVTHLLSTTRDYVLLGIFTTDFLETMFGKLRQGSGGTYFITVQQVLEKLYIHKTKLLLNLNVDVSSFNVLSGHSYECCQFLMGDHTIDVFDNLPKLEISLPTDVKETSVYIAGYIIHKEMPVDGTFNYFSKFGDFTNEMSRGGLAKPTDTLNVNLFSLLTLFFMKL